MTDLANFIRINEDDTISGNIASISYDLDVTGEPYTSANERAPAYRLFARSPRGRRIEVTATLVPADEREATWALLERNWPGYRGYERAAGRELRIFRLTPRG